MTQHVASRKHYRTPEEKTLAATERWFLRSIPMSIRKMSDAEALSIAMLLGYECRRVGVPDTPGYRWNSGSTLGEWAPSPADGARRFLATSSFNSLMLQYLGG